MKLVEDSMMSDECIDARGLVEWYTRPWRYYEENKEEWYKAMEREKEVVRTSKEYKRLL